MRKDEDTQARQAGHVCPACGQPVEAEVTRHKTMGMFVPVYKPGPCHNPDCREHAAEDDEIWTGHS